MNTALPKVAEAPQQSVAIVINKYPRHGCLATPGGATTAAFAKLWRKHLVQPVRIKTDHDLLTDNNGWGGAAVVLPDQFKDRRLVHAYVFHFKLNTSRREVGLGHVARRSPRLAEDHYFFLLHQKAPNCYLILVCSLQLQFVALYFVSTPLKRTSVEIWAVVFSIAETEQYFSSDNRTASSTALRETVPETV